MKCIRRIILAIVFLFITSILTSCGFKNTPDNPSTLHLQSFKTNEEDSTGYIDDIKLVDKKNIELLVVVKNDYAYVFDNIKIYVSALDENFIYYESNTCSVSYSKDNDEIITSITLKLDISFDENYYCSVEVVEINFFDYLGYNMKADLNYNCIKNKLEYGYSGIEIDGKDYNRNEMVIDNLKYRIIGGYAVCLGPQAKNIRVATMVSEINYTNFFGVYTYPVTVITYNAFYNCSSLTSVKLSNKLECINSRAFMNCNNLRRIEVPDSLINIEDGAFEGCDYLNYSHEGDCKYLGNSKNPYYALIEAESKNKVLYEINEATALIGPKAFKDCEYLESINLPNGIKSICAYGFYSCDSLKYINLPKSIVNIGMHTFSRCSKLERVEIPDKVETIEPSTFNECSNLSEIILPNSVKFICSNAFNSCSKLISIVIPKSVISIDSKIFYSCINLYKVYYEDNREFWEYMTGKIDLGLNEQTNVYYYSELEPTKDGNYWHYDNNGNVIEW